jgi:uncharacterized protein (DUF169 family)
MDYAALDNNIVSAIGPVRLVAVGYLDSPPAGSQRFSGTVPSGCTFWRLAARGPGFYTVPDDHLNCAIGSYTHAIDLPAARTRELEQTLSLMSGLGYLRLEEVPSIPRLPATPAFTYYAPLSHTLVDPDVVIAAGRPGPLMLLQEASARAGATSQLPLLGRPTCMALPAALGHGSVMSSGCIGNRVYTDLGEDELYLMIPGRRIQDVVDALTTIVTANRALEEYHHGRREALMRD